MRARQRKFAVNYAELAMARRRRGKLAIRHAVPSRQPINCWPWITYNEPSSKSRFVDRDSRFCKEPSHRVAHGGLHSTKHDGEAQGCRCVVQASWFSEGHWVTFCDRDVRAVQIFFLIHINPTLAEGGSTATSGILNLAGQAGPELFVKCYPFVPRECLARRRELWQPDLSCSLPT